MKKSGRQRLDRILTAIVIMAFIYTAWNAYRVFGGTEPAASASPLAGARVDAQVERVSEPGEEMAASTTEPVSLSALYSGQCRLVVVSSPFCGPSRVAAQHWSQDFDPSLGSRLPASWSVFWVSAFADSSLYSQVASGFPVELWVASNPNTFLQSVGIKAFPAHLVLDKDGRVVKAGVGALLPDREQLLPTCEIVRIEDVNDANS